MQENKRRRVQLNDSTDFGWSQNRTRGLKNNQNDDKGVYSNTVQNDNILFRTARAAREAEQQLHAARMGQETQRNNDIEDRARKENDRRIREGLDVRNQMIRQEKKLGMEGTLSKEELRKAQYDTTGMLGKEKPMDVKKKDVKGLEIKKRRSRKAGKHSLLPSERKNRLARARLKRNRDLERNRRITKGLSIKDANGNKISLDRLRQLRGLSKTANVSKRDVSKVKTAVRQKPTRSRPLRRREERER